MTDMEWNQSHVNRLADSVANRLGVRATDGRFRYKGHDIEFIHEMTDLNNGIAYMKVDGGSMIPLDSDNIDDVVEMVDNNISKSFNSLVAKQRGRNHNMRKTPIMEVWPGNTREDVAQWDEFAQQYHSDEPNPLSIHDIDYIARNASVVPGGFGSSVDVIWYLPSGNHPGLYFCDHGKEGYTANITALHFDYPDEEGVLPALESLKAEVRSKEMHTGAEIKDYARRMEELLGPIATEPRGRPIYG